MAAYFITGTGTDAGKTFFTCALVRKLIKRAQAVSALKPVISGFDAATIADSDSGKLLAAMGRPLSMNDVDAISPWRFNEPVSPDLAAEREARQLELRDITQWCNDKIAGYKGTVLIEGAGGVMSPLTAKHTNLHLTKELDIPIILLCGNYLGAISHTLTACASIAAAGVRLHALIINEAETPSITTTEMMRSLQSHMVADETKWLLLPRLNSVDAVEENLPDEIIQLVDAK